MGTTVYIAGGYGVVGSNIARHIRGIDQEIRIIVAGRNPAKGEVLAGQLGNAETAYLDLSQPDESIDLDGVDLIVAALQDPMDKLLHLAVEKGIAHIGITKLADEITPLMVAVLKSPPKRPIVPLGHSQAGVMMVVAQKVAEQFSRIDSIELAGLFDENDPMGPMTLNDAEGFINRALIRESGRWLWVDATKNTRSIRLSDGTVLEGGPMSLLDVPGLASATGAPNIRFDFIVGPSLGLKSNQQPSQDLYIDIEGILKSGSKEKLRTVVSDPKGQAHLTALGVLLSIERILGTDGLPAASGGIHLPETLLIVDKAIARLEQFGVGISTYAYQEQTIQ
ncbi:hypothetical protein I6N90_17575 [Paenibacillus sp. GSMTC-2017]|nr:hypothetical protein [Paenibacillus sp. GSMTC-2017]